MPQASTACQSRRTSKKRKICGQRLLNHWLTATTIGALAKRLLGSEQRRVLTMNEFVSRAQTERGIAAIAELAVDNEALVAGWRDGVRTRLPHLWLRHNCDCDQCMVRQTSERRFQIFTVAPDLQPTQAHLVGASNDQAITIEWPDGHLSRYASNDLHALLQPAPQPLRYWAGEFQPHLADFDDFLDDDDAAAAFVEQFLCTGVGLLVNGPTQQGALERLSARLGPVREVLFERIHNVWVDPAGYNIAHTREFVPPHNDMVSYTWPPSVQALHMLVNECEGGETGLVDGFAALERLRREQLQMFDVLCAVPVPFRQFDATNETNASAPVIELDSAGAVRMLRFSNQLMQRMPLHEVRLAEFYRAFSELAGRLNAAATMATLRLEAGQVLLISGHRVLHARAPIASLGHRHLQDAYFEHDNVRNHLTLLRRLGRTTATTTP